MTRAYQAFIVTYRLLIIAGAVLLLTTLAGRPDLAIVALAMIALGAFMRSERWKAECADEDEWAYDCGGGVE